MWILLLLSIFSFKLVSTKHIKSSAVHSDSFEDVNLSRISRPDLLKLIHNGKINFDNPSNFKAPKSSKSWSYAGKQPTEDISNEILSDDQRRFLDNLDKFLTALKYSESKRMDINTHNVLRADIESRKPMQWFNNLISGNKLHKGMIVEREISTADHFNDRDLHNTIIVSALNKIITALQKINHYLSNHKGSANKNQEYFIFKTPVKTESIKNVKPEINFNRRNEVDNASTPAP
ncbi:hypothetical protein ACJJTC_010129 [Scirpophaga incertulas]